MEKQDSPNRPQSKAALLRQMIDDICKELGWIHIHGEEQPNRQPTVTISFHRPKKDSDS